MFQSFKSLEIYVIIGSFSIAIALFLSGLAIGDLIFGETRQKDMVRKMVENKDISLIQVKSFIWRMMASIEIYEIKNGERPYKIYLSFPLFLAIENYYEEYLTYNNHTRFYDFFDIPVVIDYKDKAFSFTLMNETYRESINFKKHTEEFNGY